MSVSDTPRQSFAARLWIYQSERFPVFKHGALIAAFGASGVCLSALLRGPEARPDALAIVVAALVLFGLFFQLRVADEHKDNEDDRRFRPERPVPRGLVTLSELRGLAFAIAAAQTALVIALDARLLVFLSAVWAWMALMTAEFFVPTWLKARPILYMVSHMLIMPLIDLFATACDWLVHGVAAHDGFGIALGAFLALSFFNGCALEIARKSWARDGEREGVETYSKLWGPSIAAYAVVGVITCGLALGGVVIQSADVSDYFLMALGVAAFSVIYAALSYARAPVTARAHALENSAGIWVLATYLLLGVIPMGLRVWL